MSHPDPTLNTTWTYDTGAFGKGRLTGITRNRYFPDRIQAGALLDWDYTVGPVGNPTTITGSINGTSYSASFVKIGNRLTFTRSLWLAPSPLNEGDPAP